MSGVEQRSRRHHLLMRPVRASSKPRRYFDGGSTTVDIDGANIHHTRTTKR